MLQPMIKYMKNKIDIWNIALLLIFLISVFFIIPDVYANAETITNNITSSSNSVNQILDTNKYDKDVSVNILKTLFGGLPLFGSGEDGLQHIFAAFNICILFLGGVLLSYSFFLGLVGTANTGKTLGSYNTTMTPLRISFGVAFILPVANGYALIQLIIMWLVLQGIALADFMWSSFVDDKNLASTLAVQPVQPEARLLAKNILLASVCMAAVNKQAEIDGDNIKMAWSFGYGKDRKILDAEGRNLVEYVKSHPTEKIILNAGEVEGRNGISDSACGSVVINSFSDGKDGLFSGIDGESKAIEAGNAIMGGSIALNSNASKTSRGLGAMTVFYSTFRIAVDSYNEHKDWMRWLSEMNIEHAAATDYLLNESNKIAVSIVENVDRKIVAENNAAANKTIKVETYDPETGATTGVTTKQADNSAIRQVNNNSNIMSDDQIFKSIDGLASKYQSYIRGKAARSYKDGVVYDTLVKNANEYGWMLAGSFYTQMGGMTDAVNQIALQTPMSSATYSTPDRLKNTEFNSKYLSKVNYYLNHTNTYRGDPVRVPTVDKAMNNDGSGNGVTDKFLASGLNLSVLTDGLTRYVTNYAISDQEHPIMQLKRLGNLMFATGSAIMMVMLSGFGEMSDNSAVFLISMFGYTMITALYAGGITMSYIVPMLPSLIWLGMCFGWLIMVMQAMIASPLWIVMHLAPHKGDDFIGAQKNGYMLVLSLILRPTLMTIGFIFSVLALNVLGYFINNFFMFIYSMSQVGTNSFIAALFGVFVVPVMYCAVVYMALKEMLSIMHRVPDELLSWFGGGGQQLGGYAQKLSDGSVQAFGMVSQRATSPFDRMKQGLAERQNVAAQQAGNRADKAARDERHQNELKQAIMGGGFSDLNNSMSTSDINPNIGGGGGGSAASVDPMENSIYSGDINNNMNDASTEMWQKAINDRLLQGNAIDIAYARKHIYPVPEQYMQSAISSAINDLSAERKEMEEKNGGVLPPYSNREFADRVNQHLNKSLFGEENAHTFNQMIQMANNRTGNNKAGEILMRGTYKKIAGVSNRDGSPYDVAAKDVGNDITSAMRGFAQDNGPMNNPDGSVNIDQLGNIANYAGYKDDQSYKQAGTMINAWKKTVQGSGDIHRSDPSLDQLHYQTGKGFYYNKGGDNNMS